MSSEIISDLGGPSPEGRQGGSAGTGEFLTAEATLHSNGGETNSLRAEVSSHRFRWAPTQSLIQALKEEGADLEETDRIEVQIGGEELTLKQTGWEIQ